MTQLHTNCRMRMKSLVVKPNMRTFSLSAFILRSFIVFYCHYRSVITNVMFCGPQSEAPQCWSVGILITNTQHNCFLLSNIESPAPGGWESQLISAPRYFESVREGDCCITVQFNYHGRLVALQSNKFYSI